MADKAIVTPDPLILTILSILAERPSHPYEIQRLIRERHKDFAIVPSRSLYHAVERLQQAGLIEPIETSREGKRPERTIYRITAEGNEDLVTWLTQLLSTPKQEYPTFMVALSLLGNLSAEIVTRALQTRAALLEGETAGLNATLRALAVQLPRLVLLEMEYTLAIRQAELNWVRTILDDLRTGKVTWQFDALPPELFKRGGSEAA